MTAANQTAVITLTGMFGKGYPALMVKLSSSEIQVDGNNFAFFDYRVELSQDVQSVTITLTNETRMAMNPLCEKAGYNNGTAGNPTCGIYIGV